MFCLKCGKQLPDDATFCAACGASLTPETPTPATPAAPEAPNTTVPAAPKAKKSKKPFLLGLLAGVLCCALLIGVFAVTGLLPKAKQTAQGAGYDSPEAAAKAYLKALRDCDFDAALATFAIESYGEGFHDDTIPYNRFIWDLVMSNLGDTNGFAFGAEKARQRAVSTIMADYTVLALDGDWPLEDGEFPLSTDQERASLRNALCGTKAKKRLASMKIGDSISLDELVEAGDLSERYVSQAETLAEKLTERCGAQDCRYAIVELTLDGTTYRSVVQTLQYDGKWYMYSGSVGFIDELGQTLLPSSTLVK